jgi:hypothetical protein
VHLEPATPRGLTAAVLSHLGNPEGPFLRGIGDDEAMESWITLADPAKTTSIVSAMAPDPNLHLGTPCVHDSGSTVVLCKHLPDGGVISIVRWTADTSNPNVLAGDARRADGSFVMVHVRTDDEDTTSNEVVEALIQDPAIGWYTTPEFNRVGKKLTDYYEMTGSVEPA